MVTPQQDWVPSTVDITVPSMARAYDYLLGGAHNFEVDRALSTKAEQALPGLRQLARMNRAFLGRAVQFMAESGVRQFLDVGAGIPLVGAVHERAPGSRVVYVDRDPVAIAHSELLLAAEPGVGVVRADLRDTEGIFDSPQVRSLFDLDEPVGVLMLFVLHWVPDSWSPMELLADYRDRLAPGSFLAISHASADQRGENMAEVSDLIAASRSNDQVRMRSRAEIEPLFTGFDLVEPGLVGCGHWRPSGPGDIAAEAELNTQFYVGVGRKP